MSEELTAFVKDRDPPFYWSTLFAPAAHRYALITLYAFAIEMKRIRFIVSDPALAQIRLQWWREGLEGKRASEFASAPLGQALGDVVKRYQLPMSPLLRLIDMREQEIDTGGFATNPHEAMIETYCGSCHAVLIHLVMIIVNGGDDAGLSEMSGHAGMVLGLIEALRESRLALSRADLASLARDHLGTLRPLCRTVPDHVKAAYLPLVVAEPFLNSMTSENGTIEFTDPSALSILWRMTRFKI